MIVQKGLFGLGLSNLLARPSFCADFLFLVDDLNPIEAGLLPDGSPDLYFRGFYCWNSEVGDKTLGIASFYLRAVCQNRNLWGVEDFQEIEIRHSKYAASRFAHEAAPALTRPKRLRAKRMLQAYDGRLAGASQREIAKVIFKMPAISRDEWQSASQRFAVMALLRNARRMVDGGYLTLLRPRELG
jgi:hypothetical protein